ncbi:aquaporin-like protein [Obba rivulosa]|uniref:Aquaporin-like protein n=1 Tax=Obba rivulosa TaxID=1052685 RepID=A0A8E2DSD7_9APHY|nr:aquaporin-like protein [Obba rivulosa]
MATARSRVLFANIAEDFLAASLEYVGTTVFLLLAFGGIQATQGEIGSGDDVSASGVERLMYIALSMGFSLLVSAWLFFRVTGALFNPNISLALLLVGVIGPVRFVLYCIAQLAGGITAAGLVQALTPGPLASNVLLAPGINSVQGVFIEMFITAILVLSVLMLAAEKHFTTPFAPVGIGLTLFACHLQVWSWAVYFTGAGMNTARAFGPAVVTGFPHGNQWVWWVGPCLGSFLGAGFYSILKHYRYWRLNPGQDTTDHRASPPDPVDNVKSVARHSGSKGSRGIGRQSTGIDKNGRLSQSTTSDTAGTEKRMRESDANPV